MRGALFVLIVVFALPRASTAQTAQPAAAIPIGSVGATGLRPSRDNPSTSIQELARIEGDEASWLGGMGIVTGLRNTGDSGTELAIAAPLAKIYEKYGAPLPDLKSLAKSKMAAVVLLSVDIPEAGGRSGDRFDVKVSASNTASSLRGGILLLSPLAGPLPGQGVYGFAQGSLVIEETDIPTVGIIRKGAQLIRDIKRKNPIAGTFNLVVRPEFKSYHTTQMIATEINGLTADLENADSAADVIAAPVDDCVIRVTIPENERGNPAAFVGRVMTKRFSPTLINLPAQVVVNERTGSIIITGDVEISAVTVGSDRIIVTTSVPPPIPTNANPLIDRTNVTDFGTTSSSADRARIQDLLQAFKRLNVPAREQIQILAQIHQTGRLHAKFITD